MEWLNRLFGRRARKPILDRLLSTIEAFIQADAWSAARRTVDTHRESLSDEADVLLGQVATVREHDDTGHMAQEQRPSLWADPQVEPGNSLAHNPVGGRAEDLEQTIAHYQHALQVYTCRAFPAQCHRSARNRLPVW
ncbi:MAG: hypothetical protein M3220_00655 [Chloroflexota bacterium]|nr:hypothetical protein [Chloroflexota bacterium]